MAIFCGLRRLDLIMMTMMMTMMMMMMMMMMMISYQNLSLFVFLLEPIRWPVGTYGIPKPVSGCPMTDGFQWKTGWRSQDTNGANSNNSKSMEFHLDGSADETKVNRSFCIKKDPTKTQNRTAWPPGNSSQLSVTHSKCKMFQRFPSSDPIF